MILAGALVGAAGVLAVALTIAPTGSTSATAIAPATSPEPIVAAVVPSSPAPEVARAIIAPAPVTAATTPSTGIVSGSAGMVIAIDPETGEVGMPNAEQLAELKVNDDLSVTRDAGGIQTTLLNGTVIMDLQGTNMDYAVVRKAKDGSNVVGCVQHPDQVDHVHPAPTELEEK
jgi:hypothetical protein